MATSPRPILRFAYDQFPGSLPVLLAEKLGYLRDGRCAVELVLDNEHMQTNSRFAAGFYSGMATTLGSAVAISAVVPQQRIVYIKDDSRGADMLLGQNSIATLHELRGKKIGVLVGDFGEYWLDSLLSKVDLDISDVEVVPVNGNAVPQLLAEQKIDAGHTWMPYAEQGIARGQKILADTIQDEFVIVDVVVFRKEAIAHYRPCIKEFLRAWSRAVDFWRAHPSEATAILGRALGQDSGSFSVDGIQLFNSRENLKILTSDKVSSAVKSYAYYFQKRGMTIPQNVEDELLDPTLIQELDEAEP
ncbi:MAG TPA: ABC transporter substrate-binding protein [Oligoflexus sp.]|uniref:ABC transporter substrate-binding protein n=1 Tax=Oligoflexus sp. TaxID=1971216 RepID=UPI002D260E88|nr:ABC transporter substrate-binding protein [Oligoflexus sp.]HYX31578.1 ABC transporter substrate-binding protein [Oligoflexus sp.]